jgi:hypothetical protein
MRSSYKNGMESGFEEVVINLGHGEKESLLWNKKD